MNTTHQVYEFQDETQGLIPRDELFLIVNEKLFQLNGNLVKAEDIFMKMNVFENKIVGWSPLESLELNEETGCLVSGSNNICFATSKGEQVRIKKVRNKIFMFSDKESTTEVDAVFESLLASKNDVISDNKSIKKLLDLEYTKIAGGKFIFMYKDGEEPYLFMDNIDELSLLDIDETYTNEDTKKYHISNIDKDLLYDRKNGKITIS